MAFLDLDEIEQDSKDANIVSHPLKDKLAESEKAAYINAIVFAGLADDDTLSDIELEYGRTRALSLGLNADDFDEAVKTVQSLNGPKERKEFLFEMLAAFTDRTVAMYVLCDMAQAMASDGDLTDDACKFLDSLYRLLLKSDKKPDNPLTPADQKFLSAYRPFLAPGKTADASEVVQKRRLEGYEFPAGLVQFFSHDLKPVQLQGGETGPGEFRIVGGVYRLDEALTISACTHLVLHDAEIVLGSKGVINLCGNRIDIENCSFRTLDTDGPVDDPYMIRAKLSHLNFKNCKFHGRDKRAAVSQEGNLTLVACDGCHLLSKLPIFSCQQKLCFENTTLTDCSTSCSAPIIGYEVYMRDCIFVNVNGVVNVLQATRSGVYACPIELAHCKFDHCGFKIQLAGISDYGHGDIKIKGCWAVDCQPSNFGSQKEYESYAG